MNYADIRAAFLTGRQPHDALVTSEREGVYAFFLQPRGLLLPIQPGPERVLYVGVTKDGLEVRNHFEINTGFSTLRRSLGAILRRELALRAVPRSGGAKPNPSHYMFAFDGEEIVSRWMRANLLASFVPIEGQDMEKLEAQLITDLQPPLNLTGWPNPQRALIKKLRARCVQEAGESRVAA